MSGLDLNTAVRVVFGAARRLDESTGVEVAFQRSAAAEVVTDAVWALIDDAIGEVSNFDRVGLAELGAWHQRSVLRSAGRNLAARIQRDRVSGGAL